MRLKSVFATGHGTGQAPAHWLHTALAQPASATNGRAVPSPSCVSRDSGLIVECLDWDKAGERLDEWRQLARNSHETNVFVEPAFALSAAQHFPVSRRPLFLFVSESTQYQQKGRLAGVVIIDQPRGTASLSARLWHPQQMALPVPLIGRDHGFDVLDAVHDWLSREFPGLCSLMLPAMPAASPIAALVHDHARARGLQICDFDTRERAVLRKDADTGARLSSAISGKRAAEFKRQYRRLSELGALTFATATTGPDIRNATEDFLALETKGWKGARGTSLLSDAALATFARTMTRRFAAHGQCEIDGIYLNGKAIAMGIILTSGKSAFLWKIAYDEDYAAYSPGMQLTLKQTERFIAARNIDFADSCAVPNHPMINRIWPDRAEIVDLLVGFRGRSANRFLATASLESARRKARAMAKRAYYTIRQRRVS